MHVNERCFHIHTSILTAYDTIELGVAELSLKSQNDLNELSKLVAANKCAINIIVKSQCSWCMKPVLCEMTSPDLKFQHQCSAESLLFNCYQLLLVHVCRTRIVLLYHWLLWPMLWSMNHHHNGTCLNNELSADIACPQGIFSPKDNICQRERSMATLYAWRAAW